MYDFAFPGAETDDSSGMIGFLFQTAFFQFFISESAFVRERLIELDDKVIFEVLGYSATVTGGIADDFIFFRNYFYVRTLSNASTTTYECSFSGKVKRNRTARSVGVISVTTSCSAKYTL